MTTKPPAPPAHVKVSVSDAMTRLWAKFLPEIERRVDVLDAVASALAVGTLPPQARQNAHGEAHKLAGSLGTFGLQRGTEVARQAELALAEEPPAATASELAAWVAELRILIESRS